MKDSVEFVQANVPVTVWKLEGELDATNYIDVIDKAKKLYDDGTRDLLMDLSDLTFMSSSGLVSLHGTVLVMRGQPPPDPEAGWEVFHAIERDVQAQTGFDPHCKILNPQPRVAKALKVAGFDTFLAVFDDRKEALASF